MDAKTEANTERAYRQLVRKLLKLTVEMEEIGENDVGLLHRSLAGRFHRSTNQVRKLTTELMQDVMWPREGAL